MNTVSYQCPNCNAALEFDGGSGLFRCLYCEGSFNEQQIKSLFQKNEGMALDETVVEPEDDTAFTDQSGFYTCPNCAAGLICDTLTSSTRCHFCHTPVILSGRLSGEFKPDVIIPFSTTQEDAQNKFNEYIKGKFLLPKGFKDSIKVDISALYVPYWLKSGMVDANFTARGKIIRTWRTGDTIHTHTQIFDVIREAELEFQRVPCDGSKRLDDALLEAIEPYDYKTLKAFSMSYLSGCAAEKYDVTKEEAAQSIDKRIKTAAEQTIRQSATQYTVLEGVQTGIDYRSEQYIYALLPVWFLNYQYGGKDYSIAMNGQTGNIFGKLPVSRVKKFLFGAGVFVAATVIGLLIGGMM